jgi:hypothetical protein
MGDLGVAMGVAARRDVVVGAGGVTMGVGVGVVGWVVGVTGKC